MRRPRTGWRLPLSAREGSLAGIYVVLFLAITAAVPRFATIGNIEQILLSVSILAIVAVGQMLVILTRNIDISVGSMVGLTAFMAGDFYVQQPHWPVLAIVVVGCLLGLALGMVNGLLVTVGGVPAIMATLGTLYIYRGIASFVAGERQLTAYTVPSDYRQLATAEVLGINVLIIYALCIGAVAWVFLRYLRPGRLLYAIGDNPEAARLEGIPTKRLIFGAFAICGLLSGFAGVLWGARFATVTADSASGLELQVIAAVVVGGVNIFGGVGSVGGVFLGALFLGTIGNALALLRMPPFWLQAISGFAILVAVTADHIVRRKQRQRKSRSDVKDRHPGRAHAET